MIPGKKSLSPIISIIVRHLIKHGADAKINGKEKARIVYLHFGGIFMLYKYFVARGKEKTIIVFHGTDLHGYVVDFSFFEKLKYLLNSWSNYALMYLCDEIYVVSNSLIHFIPLRYMIKTSVLFLGVDCDKVRLFQNKDERNSFGFVDNNNRGIKNAHLAYNYAMNQKSNILRLSGYEHREFLSLLSSCKRGLLITSFQEGSPNVLKEALILGLEVTCVDVGDCLHMMRRFGGKLISYNGELLHEYESLPSYSLSYMSIDVTVFQLIYG